VIGAIVAIGVVVLGWAGYQWWVEPPTPGAFYRPPDPLPDEPSGSLIRTETVDELANGAEVQRMLYHSTDPDGDPIAVSGIAVIPPGEPPPGGWPVVAWAHGTTGVASRCAPSLEGGAGAARIPALTDLTDAGYIVVATDYPGLGTAGPHPYLVGESEGRAVLDAIRAAHHLPGDGVSARSAVFGHSQGGHATLFAAALAATYAPELELVGVAAMAPPTDLGVLLERDISEVSGLVLTALALDSWSKLYSDVDLGTIVHDDVQGLVEKVGERCIETPEQSFADAPDLLVLRERFLSADPADAPGWSTHLAANSPGSQPLSVPVLVSQGLVDTLVRPDITEEYVAQQCAAGASIALDTYPGIGHFDLRTAAPPRVLAWLEARFAGTPQSGCVTTEVDT
jgi:pimeloyl-ACP methyl ester carboxylesterase